VHAKTPLQTRKYPKILKKGGVKILKKGACPNYSEPGAALFRTVVFPEFSQFEPVPKRVERL